MSASGGGEASYTREDGDDASDERPLKKARFAWQVKGKHHLRHETASPAAAPSESDSETDEAAASCAPRADSAPERDERVPESPGRDDAVSGMVVFEKINNYFSSRKSDENYILERWQSRQIGKVLVDNVINGVLDTWSASRRRHLNMNLDEFDTRFDSGDDEPEPSYAVENEGILMAISAHGLSNADRAAPAEAAPPDILPAHVHAHDCRCAWRRRGRHDAREDALLPVLLRTRRQSPVACEPWESSRDGEPDERAESDAHYDFLDAAVTFAIHYKGLTSLSGDNG